MSSKAGWITKEGGRYKNWKRRWMAIEGDVICYYKSEVRGTKTQNIKIQLCNLVFGVMFCLAGY